VEDGVDVVEDVLRAEGGGEIAVAIGDEFQAQAGGEGGDEIGALKALFNKAASGKIDPSLCIMPPKQTIQLRSYHRRHLSALHSSFSWASSKPDIHRR